MRPTAKSLHGSAVFSNRANTLIQHQPRPGRSMTGAFLFNPIQRRFRKHMNTIPPPAIQTEIISAPAVHQMTVTPVGSNMFSLNLNVVMVVRFPDNHTHPEHATAQIISNSTPVDSSDATYADGSQPAPGGETAAFQDFLHANGYPPPTRQSLSEWAQSQS